MTAFDAVPADYVLDLGARLRAVRNRQGLSLAQVEEKSRGYWKGVVVGSYERGDRSITVDRFVRLAAFYDVDPRDILPGGDPVAAWGAGRRKAATSAAARAVLNAIPAAIENLPRGEFEEIATAISAGVRERLELTIASHWKGAIAELEREVAELRSRLPEGIAS